MGGKGFFGMRIKLAGTGIAFDGGIKLRRIECLEPDAKPRQFARSKLFDGFFNVFGGGHVGDIAFTPEAEKGGMRLTGWVERSDSRRVATVRRMPMGFASAQPILRIEAGVLVRAIGRKLQELPLH